MVAADTAEEASAVEAVASEEVTEADSAEDPEVPEARAREAFTEASIRSAEEDITEAEVASREWWGCSLHPL